MEQWKQIIDHPQYWISSEGRVWSEKTKKFLTPQPVSQNDKHLKVSISENNVKKKYFIHRLVMLAFCPIDNSQNLQVNHIDGNPENNHLENLEWCTDQENKKHYKEKIIPIKKQEENYNLGAKPKNIKITFSDGVVNYYQGITQVCNALEISNSSFLRWKTEGTGPIQIEYVEEIPEEYINTERKINKKSVPRAVKVKYKNKEELYENGKAGDQILGLKNGTLILWAKRETNKQTPTMRKIGILRVEFVEI